MRRVGNGVARVSWVQPIVEVDIPRPRSRETMIDTTEYTRLRNHILHFLLRGSHAFAALELSPA
jgi:hypothetical protein